MNLKQKELQDLLKKAMKLSELESEILETEYDNNIDFFIHSCSEFYTGVNEIKDKWIEIPAININEVLFEYDEDGTEFLQSVLNGKQFKEIDKKKDLIAFKHFVLNGIKDSSDRKNILKALKSALDGELNEFNDDISGQIDPTEEQKSTELLYLNQDDDYERDRKLADETLLTWFSEVSAIRKLREASTVIFKTDTLPEFFRNVFTEIKYCFAFEQHLAVTVLCRTSIEIAIRDLYVRLGFKKRGTAEHAIAQNYFFEKRPNKNKSYPWEYDPRFSDMKELICKLPEFENYKDNIEELYSNLSSIIHGNSISTKSEDTMRKTTWLIHDLYAEVK